MARFTAIGGGDSIGGSAYLYEDDTASFLIDFGAIQGPKSAGISYPRVPQSALDFMLLSHDHLDHCGGLPLVMREHRDMPVFSTNTARFGAFFQLDDSAKIAEQNARIAELSGRTEYPAFTGGEAHDVMHEITPVRDSGWFEPFPGYKVSYRSAGHKRGAAIILIVCPDGRRIVHACDFSLHDQALVRGAVVPRDFLNPDLLVTECTYGARSLPSRAVEEKRLVDAVRRVLERGGKVIIPHFASTCQHIALPLARAGIASFLDGMARDFWHLYLESEDHWCEHDIPITEEEQRLIIPVVGNGKKDWEVREGIKASPNPAVVIATGGMLEGGPAVGYVEAFLEDPKNAVIIPGYQAPESQGRKLIQLQRRDRMTFSRQCVRPDGIGVDVIASDYYVEAEVIPMHLSGHSDGDEVARWVAELNPKTVITVHGEPAAHEGLRERISRLNGGIGVVSSKTGESIAW